MSAFAAGYSDWFRDEIKFRISSGKMRAQNAGRSVRDAFRGKASGPSGGQLWRVAQGSRAAVFKRIGKAGCHHPKQLGGQLAYINGKSKAVFGNAVEMMHGQKVLEDEAVDGLIERWAEGWKRDRIKTKNGYTTHLVLSFPDDVTDAQAAHIAADWCAEMFESRTHGDDVWKYYAALHTDTANPHVHVVLNNRGVHEGKWFYIANDNDFNYDLLREAMVDVAEEHGVFLDSATRLERGKLTYDAPSHEYQEAKRLGTKVVERPLPPEALVAAKEVMKQHAEQAQAMGLLAGVMKMQNLHDALVAAAVNLRDGKPVDVSAFLKEEQLVQLDLTQHPADIRQAIVQWSADNADTIAKADPVKRDRFVNDMFAALDAIDKSIDPDADIAFGDMTDAPTTLEAYKGTFVAAAVGDEERLMTRAEEFLDGPAEIQEMRSFVATGKFAQFMISPEFDTEDQQMIDAVGTAYEELTNEAGKEPFLALKEAKSQASSIGLDPEAFAQRVINGAYDARMEQEWLIEDLRRVVTHHGLDASSDADLDKASDIVYKVYDFVAESIEKLHSNHIALEPVRQEIGIDVEKDHTAFVERSKGVMNDIRVYKSATFKSKADELAYLADFKQEFGDEGIKRLAKGDLDVIKDLGNNDQERRDIAYFMFRLSKRHPSVGVDAQDASEGMKAYNPQIWHGQGGHSI